MRELGAGGFEDGAWAEAAKLQAHEQAMAAAESKDVGETHCGLSERVGGESKESN